MYQKQMYFCFERWTERRKACGEEKISSFHSDSIALNYKKIFLINPKYFSQRFIFYIPRESALALWKIWSPISRVYLKAIDLYDASDCHLSFHNGSPYFCLLLGGHFLLLKITLPAIITINIVSIKNAISAILSLHFRMIYVSIDCFRFLRGSEEEKLSTILFRHLKASAKLCRKLFFYHFHETIQQFLSIKCFPSTARMSGTFFRKTISSSAR